MILSLAFMVPAWAMLGGFARLDTPGPGGVVGGMVIGGAIGVFFGLVFGGAKGKWLDYVYGPEQPDEESEEDAPSWRPDQIDLTVQGPNNRDLR